MHSHDFVLVAAVWSILLITGITAPITQRPPNAVAEIGQQVKLTCTADKADEIDNWYFSKDGTEDEELTIVDSGCSTVNAPFGDHYRVESFGGGTACNLIVFNITMEQAGVYRCEELPDDISSILTVIDSLPAVTVNTTEPVVESEKVIITCSLSYGGSVAPAPTLRPYFYWKDFNGDNVSSSYDSTTETTAVSQITVIAARDKNITSYTCHVYLQLLPPATAYYANNIPTVNSRASSPTIEVLFSARIGSMGESSDYITIGGITCEIKVLTCHAHGNPPPSVEWFDTDENVSITKERTFDLAEINRKYTCVTNNTIRSVVYSDSLVFIGQNYSIIQDCRFPHSESTWISATPVEGCDNETCVCSSGNGGFTFLCNADSYPGALYQWIGADNSVIDSQVYANAQINGMYHCTAYFDRSSSNYTGNYIFPKGTNKKNVIECYGARFGGISPRSEFIAIGGTTCEFKVLTCEGHGNPPPSYEWFDTIEKVSLSNDATLDLAEINRSYTCAVYNTIRNEVYRQTMTYVPESSSGIKHCKFPRHESTWISATPVEGCESGTCDCSNGYDGFTLMCKADSYPCVAYQWIGPDNSVIDSQVYENAHINGKYRCTAYFNRASSNYTGNAIFPNGTSKKNVIECDELADSNFSEVAIAIGVPFGISFAVNITVLIIWLVKHLRAKQDQLTKTENVPQPDMNHLSNGTSAPSAHEDFRRPDETRWQQSTDEKLAPNFIIYARPNIAETGLDTIDNLTQNNKYVDEK